MGEQLLGTHTLLVGGVLDFPYFRWRKCKWGKCRGGTAAAWDQEERARSGEGVII